MCEWRVEGAGTFWSACNTVDRTAKEVARIATKTIAGKPWTVANPDGYPAIYLAVASARGETHRGCAATSEAATVLLSKQIFRYLPDT